MTKETIIKLHKHFSKLASGQLELNTEFSSVDLSKGLPPERKVLMISDAQRHKDELEAKFPWLVENKEEPIETTPTKKTKSKEEN